MCPPADAFLVELAQEDSLLVLSYHVTLWDFLGTPDPLSREENSYRHLVYNKRLRGRNPFTPQIVIDGMATEPGARRNRIRGVIGKIQEIHKHQVPLVLSLTEASGSEPSHLSVRIGDATDPAKTQGRVLALAYRTHRNVPIRRNYVADYVNAVYAMDDLGDWSGEALDLSVPIHLEDTTQPDGIAVLVQTVEDGEILGAGHVTLTEHQTQSR